MEFKTILRFIRCNLFHRNAWLGALGFDGPDIPIKKAIHCIICDGEVDIVKDKTSSDEKESITMAWDTKELTMTKFKVLKKTFHDGNPIGEYLTEEIVEAEDFETPEGCLLFYDEKSNHIKTFASGVWFEVESVKEEKQE